MEQKVAVELGRRSYDVRIGPGALQELGRVAGSLGRVSSAVVISDTTVAPLYGRDAMDALAAAGLKAALITFPAGESHKTLATYAGLFDRLFALRPAVDRDTLIVALGGGVCGDMAGFVAATALRGLNWMQCPTTLLADVDASVGGKTGVDHPAGKNLIGAFHQPRAVLIDVRTLKTLPPAELLSGLAECIKHAVIRDWPLLDFIDQQASGILQCDEEIMTDLVARNVAIKAAVVAADEREAGERAHLNFGHTVGHAIETYEHFALSHGQAVSLGMVAACRLAVARGLVPPRHAAVVEDLLGRLGLPVRRAGLPAEELWQIMQHDKKAQGGKVRMILPTGQGKVDIVSDIDEPAVLQAIRYLTGDAKSGR